MTWQMAPLHLFFLLERTDPHKVLWQQELRFQIVWNGCKTESMELDGVKGEKTEEEFSPMEVGRKKNIFLYFFPVCDGRWIGYANPPRLRNEVKSSIVFGVRGTLRSRSLSGGEREKCGCSYPLALSRDFGLKFWPLVPKYRGFLTPDSRWNAWVIAESQSKIFVFLSPKNFSSVT